MRSRHDANGKTVVDNANVATGSVRVFSGDSTQSPGFEDVQHFFVAIFR
jgi:hypothetical protein